MVDRFHAPATVSEEAREIIEARLRSDRDAEAQLPKGDAPLHEWQDLQHRLNELARETLPPIIAHFQPAIEPVQRGSVRGIEVTPGKLLRGDKIIMYIHGGAYVAYTADVTLAHVLPLAAATGLCIAAIDYTLAPKAKFDRAGEQVLAFYSSLVDEYGAENIAVYGDSAGGGLAAGSLLRMRDEGIPLPAVLVLWSPWSDIDQIGDSYVTLADHDPHLVYLDCLENAALAYAPRDEFRNPYVSPVYGNYSGEFPPTLIQAGSKEIFLSNAIRLYRALDDQGKTVKLDIYEGMFHGWHGFYQLPESRKAVGNTKQFIFEHLDPAPE